MNDPARPVAERDRRAAPGRRSSPDPNDGSPSRFVPLSPRVAVLIAAAIVAGLLLWMARDSVRPFVLGLLLVYLLDIPVRLVSPSGLRRSFAILIVYVVALVAIIGFLARDAVAAHQRGLPAHRGLPAPGRAAQHPPRRARRLLLASRDPGRASASGSTASSPASRTASPGAGFDFAFLLPLVTGAGSLIGAIFGYIILPIWVFYLAKDQAKLVGRVRSGAAAGLALRHLGRAADRRARLRPVGPRAGHPRASRSASSRSSACIILSYLVDPIFGRYAILLSVIAGVLELVPVIGPIISAVPAVLIAATAGHRGGRRGARAVHARPAGREQLPRPEDPGRRDGPAPGGGHLRDHHRRRARGPARGDPRAAGPGGRRRDVVPLPLPARRPRDPGGRRCR